MFECRSCHSQVNQLRACRLQLRLGLGHIHSRRDSLVVAVYRELKRLVKCEDTSPQQLLLKVESAQLEVIGCKLSDHAQPNGLEIGGARLSEVPIRQDVISNSSPQVDLVRRLEGQLKEGTRSGNSGLTYDTIRR